MRDHLLGKETIGIYPLLRDDTCWFVAVDFDKKNWEGDAGAFLKTCRETGVPASLERSRSGNGGHVLDILRRTYPSDAGAQARECNSDSHDGAALRARTRLVRSLVSQSGHDAERRIWESHSITFAVWSSGKGHSVFVNDQLRPYDDQWAYVSSIEQLTLDDTQSLLRKVYPTSDVLNVKHSSSNYDESSDPWIIPPPTRLAIDAIKEPLPQRVPINLANLIYIEKKDLPDAFLDRLLRLAAFQNPEFYKTQAMRLSTFGKPRVIACGEALTHYIALPRGLLQEVLALFESHNVAVDVAEHRFAGSLLEVDFRGDPRPAQTEAAKALSAHDEGILCAPTAFGKTAVAAQLIAKRKVNTLVLVHRRHLMDQWRERLAAFLGLNIKDIGQIGSGKTTRTGQLDVAVIQSLIRKGEVKDIVAEYGQVIVDECHHVSAFSFERVLRKVKAKYVVGLTATPIRKDGHHPIILMQCGPIRFSVSSKRQAAASAFQYEIIPRITEFAVPPEWKDIGIQDVYTALVNDGGRTDLIVSDVVGAIEAGRCPLLLTERTDHLQLLFEKLEKRVPNIFVMKGGMGKKEREGMTSAIQAVAESQRRLIIATGRYVGEGFDDALLDTLFLAMPISWRGTLQQYVGRLHRIHENKRVVRVYDYVDRLVPVLNRMYEKRLKAYKAVGYTVVQSAGEDESQADLKFAEIERIAVQTAIAFEEARGCTVETVESDTRGFDLISRVASPNNEGALETRFIEVKGRAAVGEIALTANEYQTAQRLGEDYWLYVVFNCASAPQMTTIQNPACFDWEPLSKIDCYRIGAEAIFEESLAPHGHKK